MGMMAANGRLTRARSRGIDKSERRGSSMRATVTAPEQTSSPRMDNYGPTESIRPYRRSCSHCPPSIRSRCALGHTAYLEVP